MRTRCVALQKQDSTSKIKILLFFHFREFWVSEHLIGATNYKGFSNPAGRGAAVWFFHVSTRAAQMFMKNSEVYDFLAIFKLSQFCHRAKVAEAKTGTPQP